MVKVVTVKMAMHIETDQKEIFIEEVIVAKDRILLCSGTKAVIAVLINNPHYSKPSGIALLSDALSQIHSATSTRSATASAEDAGKTQPT